MIVVTDGEPNEKVEMTEPYIFEAKAKGITIIAVGVTNNVKRETLDMLASSPANVGRIMKDYESISQTKYFVITKILYIQIYIKH